jgi:protein PET100, fungi type
MPPNPLKMGGLNLEVFKVGQHPSNPFLARQHLTFFFSLAQFGVYVLFPIGIMYYFGTNLDNRFAVSDFWPKPENANKLPLERDEIRAELERLRARRLYNRERRLAAEANEANANPTRAQDQQDDKS